MTLREEQASPWGNKGIHREQGESMGIQVEKNDLRGEGSCLTHLIIIILLMLNLLLIINVIQQIDGHSKRRRGRI